MLPGVARAPHARLALRREAGGAAADREDEDRVRLVGVDDDREPEVGRQPLGDRDPGLALVVGAVDAAVVLGEQPASGWTGAGSPCARTGRTRGTAGPRAGTRPGCPGCAAPRTSPRRGSGRRRRSRGRRSPTRCRRGAGAACGTPGRRSRRPTRCGAGGPTARARARRWRRRSVDLKTAAGSVPAYTTSGSGPGTSCQTRSTEASSAVGEADRVLLPGLPEVVGAEHLRAGPAQRRTDQQARCAHHGCRPDRSRSPSSGSADPRWSIPAVSRRIDRSTGPSGSRSGAASRHPRRPPRRVSSKVRPGTDRNSSLVAHTSVLPTNRPQTPG